MVKQHCSTFRIITAIFKPSHEIMALFVLRKLILQMRMCSHPVGLDVWFLVGPFVYFHSSCVRTVKALARLHGCAGSSEPLLVTNVISTIISWDGSFLGVWNFSALYDNYHSPVQSLCLVAPVSCVFFCSPQGLHSVCRGSSWYVPWGQGRQSAPEMYVPMSQSPAEQVRG